MGTAISLDANGNFCVPHDPIIPVIVGDEVGADIWHASQPVLDEAVKLVYTGGASYRMALRWCWT